jgi:hypothetical protein
MTERPIDRWTRLRGSGEGDGAIEVPSISSGVETGFGPVRFAIGPEGQPRLMVPCGPDAAHRGDVSNGKLSVALSRYEVAGRKTLFLDVMCVERALDPVFAELADEIVHRVADGEAPSDAVESTISDFRDLLKDAERTEIPVEKILGLVGELVVLRSLVRTSPQAIEAWTGPFEQRHDFRRREHAIEVKTSARADETSVSISSCEQLSEPAGGSLMLVHLIVERAESGELSVSGLSSEIVANGVPRPSLKKALAAIGCSDPESPEWNCVRYELEKIIGYRVASGFPRITTGQFPGGVLPHGIESIAYSVDLSSARQFVLSDEELTAGFSRIAS